MEPEVRKKVQNFSLYVILFASLCVLMVAGHKGHKIKQGASLRPVGGQTVEIYFRRMGWRYISPSESEALDRLGLWNFYGTIAMVWAVVASGLGMDEKKL